MVRRCEWWVGPERPGLETAGHTELGVGKETLFYVCGIGDRTQGLACSRQVFYRWVTLIAPGKRRVPWAASEGGRGTHLSRLGHKRAMAGVRTGQGPE